MMRIEAKGFFRPTSRETKKVVQTLTNAFQDYPMYKYYFTDEKKRRKYLNLLHGILVKYCIKKKSIITSSENMEGVMLYHRPSENISYWEMVKAGAWKMPFTINPIALRIQRPISKAMEKMHGKFAPRSHLYLWVLAVDPAEQGKRYASKLLDLLVINLDKHRVAGYLETFLKKNVDIYERFGFEVMELREIPNTDLKIWGMLRKPLKNKKN